MKILLIYAHPPGDSFNQALKDIFLEGVQNAGHQVDLIDLYQDGFDPVLPEGEMRGKTVPDIVRGYQERIRQADVLVFIFPVWWYRSPAILEGFIDRVFTSGFAYKYIGRRPKGLLPCRRAVVIETYGGPAFYYYLTGNIPWRRFKSTLKFCGIRKFVHHPCFYTPFTSDKKRKRWLEQIRRTAGKLNSLK